MLQQTFKLSLVSSPLQINEWHHFDVLKSQNAAVALSHDVHIV
jgi:hypothetical protein